MTIGKDHLAYEFAVFIQKTGYGSSWNYKGIVNGADYSDAVDRADAAGMFDRDVTAVKVLNFSAAGQVFKSRKWVKV